MSYQKTRFKFLFLVGASALLPTTGARAATVDDLTALTFDAGQGKSLPYRLYVPKGYDNAKHYRLVLFFHGAGERGTDNRSQIAGQPAPLVFVEPENQSRWPTFFVAPQCPGDQQWVGMNWGEMTGAGKLPANPTWPMAAALQLVDSLRSQYPGIDADKIYVTGFSMGGYGVWDAIYRRPGLFRRAAPICGGYDPKAVSEAPGTSGRWFDIPLWLFHGFDDSVVQFGRSVEMVDAMKNSNSTVPPKLTRYENVGHFSWGPAYAEKGLLEWMFEDSVSVDAGTADSGTRGTGNADSGTGNGDNGKSDSGTGIDGMRDSADSGTVAGNRPQPNPTDGPVRGGCSASGVMALGLLLGFPLCKHRKRKRALTMLLP